MEPLAPLTARISADTLRRVKIEAAESRQTVRELVQVALEDLLARRQEERRGAGFGRCSE